MKDKKKILEENIGFIVSEVKKYMNKHNISYEYLEDLIQEGYVGYLIALDKYKEDKNAGINTYAYHWIYSRLEAYRLKNLISPLKVPVYVYRTKYDKDNDEYVTKKDNKKVGTNVEYGLNNIFNSVFISLDAEVYKDEKDSDKYEEIIKSNVNVEEEVINKIAIEEVKKVIDEVLEEREKKVIKLRYFEGYTLEEAGKNLGISRERIRQIEAKAIRKLRINLLKKGVKE